MAAYDFSNYGLLVFDNNRDVIVLNVAGKPVNQSRNVVTITTSDGLPNDGASPPRSILQPSIPIQVTAHITFITVKEVRLQDPTATLKFACTPVPVN